MIYPALIAQTALARVVLFSLSPPPLICLLLDICVAEAIYVSFSIYRFQMNFSLFSINVFVVAKFTSRAYYLQCYAFGPKIFQIIWTQVYDARKEFKIKKKKTKKKEEGNCGAPLISRIGYYPIHLTAKFLSTNIHYMVTPSTNLCVRCATGDKKN